MSVREKQLMKRRINREHNSNLRAGYVHVDEKHLHRTGIRGRKKYLVFAIIVLLLLAAIANLLITVTILFVLRIDHSGMRDIEMAHEGELIRFLGDLEVERVHLIQNEIRDTGNGITFGSNDGMPVIFKINSEASTTLDINPDGIIIKNVDNFIINDPVSGKTVFTTDFKQFRFPDTLDNFQTKRLKTNKVVSYDQDLNIETRDTGSDVNINAGASLSLQARKIGVNAQSSLNISTAGGLTLTSASGIVLKSFLEMPRQLAVHSTAPAVDNNGFKMCVCAEGEGLLFTIPGGYECHQINASYNPCVASVK